MRTATLLIGLMLAGLPAAFGAEEAGKKYAVVVGVETYDPDQLNRLRFAVDDAEALAAELEFLGFEVTLMTEKAMRSQLRPNSAEKIRKVLASQAAGRASDDLLLFALTGHGVQFKAGGTDSEAAAEVQEMFFCPEDAQLGDRGTLLSLETVYKIMEQSGAGRKLLLVDACRNDPQPEGKTRAKEIELEAVGRKLRTVPQGMLALFSCSVGETSREYPDLAHGVFSYHVLKYLRGSAEDTWYRESQLNIADLAHYVSRETRDYVWRQDSKDQIPTPYGKVSPWDLGPRADPLTRGSSARARAAYREIQELADGSDNRRALEKLKAFIKDFPAEPLCERARFAVAGCYFSLGDYEQAAEVCDTCLKDFPKSDLAEDAYLALAVSYYHLGDRGNKEQYDASVRTANAYLQRFPAGKHLGVILHAQGDVLYKQGKRAEALPIFARIVKEFPQHGERAAALHDWAVCQFELGQYAEAATTYDTFLQQYPNEKFSNQARFNRLQCSYNLGGDAQSLHDGYARLAATKDFEFVDQALVMQGKCLVKLNKIADAGVHFAQIRTKFPQSPVAADATWLAGCLLFNAGRYDEAEGWLRAGLREKKDAAPEMAHYLCQILIKKGRKAEAQALAEQYIQSGGDHPFVEELKKDLAAAR